MQVLRIMNVGTNYQYKWPSGDTEIYKHWVEYVALDKRGEHSVRIGFGRRPAYGKERVRVVVWIDDYPQAEFIGADDSETSGEVLSEIKVPGERGERICRYPDEPIPERYIMFNVVGLPLRVQAKGVHNAWAVSVNIADHKTMVAVAGLRCLEWWIGQQV